MTEMALADFGQYAHSNQPVHHVLYLFAAAGRPDLTQRWVRRVMDKMYGPGPDGFPGDEDNGEMASWFVLSALGLFPLCPGHAFLCAGKPAVPQRGHPRRIRERHRDRGARQLAGECVCQPCSLEWPLPLFACVHASRGAGAWRNAAFRNDGQAGVDQRGQPGRQALFAVARRIRRHAMIPAVRSNAAMQTQDLGGKWELRQGRERKTIAATVPGCVHTDLCSPPARSRTRSTATTRTACSGSARPTGSTRAASTCRADCSPRERVLLRCEGLDTLATIRVNGRARGADGQHVPHVGVRREAAPAAGREHDRGALRLAAAVHPRQNAAGAPLPDWGVGEARLDGRAWVRKEPCNFGWDWGPTLVTCGIWRAIELVGVRRGAAGGRAACGRTTRRRPGDAGRRRPWIEARHGATLMAA